jgi:hypothetical protein
MIFYKNLSGFTCGPTLALTCYYLEAAPTSGTNAWADATYFWSGNITTSVPGTTSFIGAGYKNTLAIIANDSTVSRAGTISQGYRGPNSVTDWYLPSINELSELFLQKTTLGLLSSNYYWSSTDGGNDVAYGIFDGGAPNVNVGKSVARLVRPIRAF